MGKHAEWEVVNKKDGIVLIRDLGRSGCLSITNDAEFVFDQLNSYSSKASLRVVYQDTEGEWAEIVRDNRPLGSWGSISFKPWHGEVWDKLTR